MTLAPLALMNDGRRIPQVGFGVLQVPDDEVTAATLTAFECGYRHVDTAAIYENERGVGLAVKDCGLPREDLFITTKVWNTDHGYDATLRAFDRSLELLGVDYVDLYLVHWPSPATGDYLATWDAVLALHDRGVARSVGVSNFHVPHLESIIERFGVVPAINQIELHPWLPQAEIRAFDAQHGILTEAWSPLAAGQLLADPALAAVGAKYGKTAAQVLFRCHLELGNVVLPKSVTPERIRQNIEVFDFGLDEEDFAAIAALETGRRTGPHPDDFM